MTDLIPNETEILISDGPRKGETLIYVGNTTIKLDHIVHIIYWSQDEEQWQAKPYVSTKAKLKIDKNKHSWNICFNCFWFDKHKIKPSKRRNYRNGGGKKYKDGICSRTNEFKQFSNVDSCNSFSNRKYGLYRSRKSLSKRTS